MGAFNFFRRLASQAEAEAGTDNASAMTPLRTAQAINAQTTERAIASQAEAEAGLINTVDMTPLRVAQAILAQVSAPKFVLVGEVVANAAASADVEFDGTYDNLIIDIVGGKVSNNACDVLIRMKVGGAYLTGGADYEYHVSKCLANSAAYAASVSAGDSKAMFCNNVYASATEGFESSVSIKNPATNGFHSVRFASSFIVGGNSLAKSNGVVSARATSGALTGIRFYTSAGTISGNFRIYGVKA